MSFVRFDPDLPNHMIVVEDAQYQCRNGHKVGDKVYNIYEEYEPYTICGLKTYEDKFEISINSPWMLKSREGTRELVAHTYEEDDFKKCFITEKEMRKRKIKNILKNK